MGAPGTSGDVVRIRLMRGSLKAEEGLDGRPYVRVNDSPETEPRRDGKSSPLISALISALISDRDETIQALRVQPRAFREAHWRAQSPGRGGGSSSGFRG